MRVCFAAPSIDLYRGGSHLPLLKAVSDIEFTILTARTSPETVELPENIELVRVPATAASYYYGRSDRSFAAEVLRSFPTDHAFWSQFGVIHLNQINASELLSLQQTDVPSLLTIHHPVTVDREVAMREAGFPRSLRWWARYRSLIREQQRMCRGVPHVMTVSETVKERLVQDYSCSESNIHVVHNGVDETVFLPGGNTLFDAIAVGSFVHPRKGFKYLLEVYRELGTHGLRIADVGRRTAKQRRALKDLPGVTVHGTVEPHQLVELLRISATLISTALYEGFGLALIEALSCGRPAFAFAGGAVAEVLDPIDPTLLVEPRDSQKLARLIIEFLELNPEERQARGQRYRREVVDRYSLERTASGLRRLYQKVARPGGSG